MNSMIERWRREGMAYVVVFADKGATGFFESMGFKYQIPFPRELYDCWIDKYSHSVLMCFRFESQTLMAQQLLQSNTTEVDVLVMIENADRNAGETWVTGQVVSEAKGVVTVQYSYMLRNYSETLKSDSIRIKCTE
jgi:hypothetical protein